MSCVIAAIVDAVVVFIPAEAFCCCCCCCCFGYSFFYVVCVVANIVVVLSGSFDLFGDVFDVLVNVAGVLVFVFVVF